MSVPIRRRRWHPRFSLLTLLLASIFCGSVALLWIHREPWQVRMTIREQFPITSAGYAKNDAYFYTITNKSRDRRSDQYQVIL